MPKVVITDGTPDDDVIDGGNFQDWINGLGGNDEISGGNQHDVISGDGDDGGDDVITGDNGKDVVNGDGGDDDLAGNNGKDVVNGGSGRDNVSGGNGKDHLTAGPATPDDSDDFMGPNHITGGNGKDVIVSSFAFCFEDDEESDSDDGSDDQNSTVLVCPISDIMTGGRAPDTFVFYDSHGADTITDFWKDTIDLSGLELANGFDDLSYANNADGDAVIDTTEGTITLLGVDASEIEADMFLF